MPNMLGNAFLLVNLELGIEFNTPDSILQAKFTIGPDNEIYLRKILIIFLPINLNMCLGAQKNRLNETVLLSTHNICFV